MERLVEKRKVRKGLESPLYIRGLPKRYFWRFLPFVGIGAALMLAVIMTTVMDEKKPWHQIWITVMVVIPALVALYLLLFYLGEREKLPHRFNNNASTVSNRNLRDYL